MFLPEINVFIFMTGVTRVLLCYWCYYSVVMLLVLLQSVVMLLVLLQCCYVTGVTTKCCYVTGVTTGCCCACRLTSHHVQA